jgi:hypothetical protein
MAKPWREIAIPHQDVLSSKVVASVAFQLISAIPKHKLGFLIFPCCRILLFYID